MTNYQLPITNYQLPITNYQLPITNYQLPITNYQLPITNYQLPITLNHCMNQQRPSSCRLSWLYEVIEIAIVEHRRWPQGKATTRLTNLLG
ncbi:MULTISPECIES: hypothetical protein [unclassified Moorena]|uniref:hypothetical protein n=1 Tax=unclassified Moorena TaxID=2683338 RepID=UPI0025F8F7C4|nr:MULTISPECIES: hypothetical protein [unclassified Moorena]